MKSIYECLDYLLNHLYENRFKPEGQRLYFDIDHVILPALKLENHEEFKGLIDMLVEDKLAFFIEDNPPSIWPKKYTERTMITPRGIDFKLKGGYDNRVKEEAFERSRLKAIANQTLILTWVLALGAAPVGVLSIADLYWKYRWFQLPFWWMIAIANIVLSVVVTYIIWQLLLKKKRLKYQGSKMK